MSTKRVGLETTSGWLGTATITLASLGLVSVMWMLLVTATSLDPPEWLRIGGMAFIPVGIFGALTLGGIGVMTPTERRRSTIGLLIMAASVAAFIAIYNLYD